jgi:hypothetical protein
MILSANSIEFPELTEVLILILTRVQIKQMDHVSIVKVSIIVLVSNFPCGG